MLGYISCIFLRIIYYWIRLRCFVDSFTMFLKNSIIFVKTMTILFLVETTIVFYKL